MEAAFWGFIGTLVGAIAGAGASIVTTVITSRNAARLQREANSLERQERAREFQRETLLQVQDALQDAMRLMVRANLEDVKAFHSGGEWGKNYLGKELDQEVLLANRRMSLLVERIADDSLRSGLKIVNALLNQPGRAKSEAEAERGVHDAAAAGAKVMEHLGEVLRNHY